MTVQTYVSSRLVVDTGVATASTASAEHGAAPAPVQSMLVTVDFGASGGGGANDARTTVTNFTWNKRAGDRARPVATVVGRPDVLGVDDEDALLDQVTAVVTNIVDGVSFDVVAFAPQGTTGLFEVQIVGV